MKRFGRPTKRTYSLRSFFLYATLVTAVFWLGWSCHKVANERDVAIREQAQRRKGEEQLVSAQLKDLCLSLERLPGVSKVTVKQGLLNRSNPVDSKLVIAVTPDDAELDEALRDKIKSICTNRFARVPREAISVVDSIADED